MKILKYLVFAILVFVLIFIIIGFLKPSIHYGHEFTADKSLKESWAVHQDESKYAQWLKGFKSIDLISGEAGNIDSKYKVVVNPGDGQPDFEMIETILSKKEFDHIRLNFDSDMMVFYQTTSFSEKDGKTTIKTDSEVSGKGIMMRSMFAVMEMFGGAFTSQEVENMEALKKVIEQNTTDYYPVPVVNKGQLMKAKEMTK